MATTYHLGVDLGTTFTAAAISAGGEVETVDLGNRMSSVPSVVYVGPDGSMVVGEAAERRARNEPDRIGGDPRGSS